MAAEKTSERIRQSQEKLQQFLAWNQQRQNENATLKHENTVLKAENTALSARVAQLEAQLAASARDTASGTNEIVVPHPDHPDAQSQSRTMTIEDAKAKLSFFYLGSMTPTCTAQLREGANGALQGYFVQVSPSLSDLLGYTEEELLSRPFTDFLREQDRQPAIEAMAQMQAAYQTGTPAKIVDFRNIYIHKDGHEVHMRWRSQYQLSTGLTFAQVADDTNVVQLAEEQAREALLQNIAQFIFHPAVITRIRELGLDINNLTDYSETLPAAILFADIVKFSTKCQGVPSADVTHALAELDVLVSKLAAHYGVYIVKTVGDCYIAISGAPVVKDPKVAANEMLQFAYALHQVAPQISIGNQPVEFRIGIHSGDINCAIKNVDGRFTYDIFGEAVNYAARMEQHGVDGGIQVSQQYRELVEDQVVISEEARVAIKGYDNNAPVTRLAPQKQNLEFLHQETSFNTQSQAMLQLFFNTMTRTQIGKIVHQLVSDFLTPRRNLIPTYHKNILTIADNLEACNLKAAAIDLRNLVKNPGDITAEHITRTTTIEMPLSADDFFARILQIEYAGLISQNLNDLTLAHLAIILNSTDALSKIITSGEQFDHAELPSALSYAAMHGRKLLVTELCKHQPTATKLNAALHHACAAGRLNIIKVLTASGANINSDGSDGQKLVVRTITNKHVAILEWLLAQHTVAINQEDLTLLQTTDFGDSQKKETMAQTMQQRLTTPSLALRSSRSTPALRRSSSESDLAAAPQQPYTSRPLATVGAGAPTLWGENSDAKDKQEETSTLPNSATGGHQHG